MSRPIVVDGPVGRPVDGGTGGGKGADGIVAGLVARRRRSITQARALTTLGALALTLSCGGTRERSGTPKTQICPFPDDRIEGRIVQWAVDCDEHRQSKPRRSGASVLTYSQDAPPAGTKAGPTVCLSADATNASPSSLLPSPVDDSVFLAGADRLFVMPNSGGRPTPITLRRGEPGWRIHRLLGFERHASTLTLLASMERTGSQSHDTAIWRITVHGSSAIGARIPDGELTQYDDEQFFRLAIVPRCREGDRECLVVTPMSDTASTVSIESRRGGDRETVSSPPGKRVIDAVWLKGQPDDGQPDRILFLVDGPCPGSP